MYLGSKQPRSGCARHPYGGNQEGKGKTSSITSSDVCIHSLCEVRVGSWARACMHRKLTAEIQRDLRKVGREGDFFWRVMVGTFVSLGTHGGSTWFQTTMLRAPLFKDACTNDSKRIHSTAPRIWDTCCSMCNCKPPRVGVWFEIRLLENAHALTMRCSYPTGQHPGYTSHSGMP